MTLQISALFRAPMIEGSVLNLYGFSEEVCVLKQDLAEKVYALLEDCYKDCGGINKGSGFSSATDMLESIPNWRVRLDKAGNVVSVLMFKESPFGNKMVAYAILPAYQAQYMHSDYSYMLRNAYAELSDALLFSVLKFLGNEASAYFLEGAPLLEGKTCQLASTMPEEGWGKSHRLLSSLLQKYPSLFSYAYFRKIGSDFKAKVMLGTVVTEKLSEDCTQVLYTSFSSDALNVA